MDPKTNEFKKPTEDYYDEQIGIAHYIENEYGYDEFKEYAIWVNKKTMEGGDDGYLFYMITKDENLWKKNEKILNMIDLDHLNLNMNDLCKIRLSYLRKDL